MNGDTNITSFMYENYPSDFTYQDFAPMFKAEFFNPNDWASLFVKSGAKYVVLTSKHHEGFTLFPSKTSYGWNSMDVGPNRDLVGDLATAIKEKGLKFGVYYSLLEWYNNLYASDKKHHLRQREYPEVKVWPDMRQLVNSYKPSVIWADGDWVAKDVYWHSTDFLAWLYNESPVKDEVVVNDRWSRGVVCRHGDFYTCGDRYNPGKLQSHKWENAFSVDRLSWGYRRDLDLEDVMTTEDIIKEVVSTVSCGGNALINIGPTKEGTIVHIFQERLLSLGGWLEINGEAIYDTSPWKFQQDSITNNSNIWYTCKKAKHNAAHPTAIPDESDTVMTIYAIILNWSQSKKILLRDIARYLSTGLYKVEMLGIAGRVEVLEDLTAIKAERFTSDGHVPDIWAVQDGVAELLLPEMSVLPSTLKFYRHIEVIVK